MNSEQQFSGMSANVWFVPLADIILLYKLLGIHPHTWPVHQLLLSLAGLEDFKMATHGVVMTSLDHVISQCGGDVNTVMGAVISYLSYYIPFILNYGELHT